MTTRQIDRVDAFSQGLRSQMIDSNVLEYPSRLTINTVRQTLEELSNTARNTGMIFLTGTGGAHQFDDAMRSWINHTDMTADREFRRESERNLFYGRYAYHDELDRLEEQCKEHTPTSEEIWMFQLEENLLNI